ncbi:MAG TPA: PQQ-dependent sugar dehydrogenase [Thermoanaerobaculia bacterium]|nr:PQQ-dependent sugar dehydrogenase [Thermoanaerobaculia bacterium]
MRFPAALAAFALLVTPVCAQDNSKRSAATRSNAAAEAPRSSAPKSTAAPGRVTDVVRGLEHPWGLAFLPDGRMLVTERPGRLRIVDKQGKLSQPLAGVPRVQAQGQGGLLDVVLDPEFAQNRTIYLSYAEAGEGGAGTAVASARFTDSGLQNVKVIYRQQPKVAGGGHFGSRIVFRRDGTLFITQGERMRYSEQAQDLKSLLGKIVRVNRDGSIPKDNPFVGRTNARPEIWSYGHRNVQAAALHPDTGALWTVEHGARGGDELNRPEAGKNYGWPVISYGREYSGMRIGQGITAKAGMEQPVYYWDPVIAPSGMVFYTGNAYPGWKGSIFVGSLQPGALVRLTLQNGRVTRDERYLGDLDERIRDVEQGPDGLLYMLTDADDGRIVRLERSR